ncbi:MAG: hypothetical protein ACKVP0_04095 [Pirellulaceae bacterium]
MAFTEGEMKIIDPYGEAAFNPLDCIDPQSSAAMDELRALADSLVLWAQDEKPFWRAAAVRDLANAMTLFARLS